MDTIVLTKNYEKPTYCEREILRYAGCKSADDELLQLLHACIKEVDDKLSYKVCYQIMPVSIADTKCDFGAFSCNSEKLAINLEGCQKVILFSATIGVEIDRLIARYGRISPAKALMFQAIGAERIESLCDVFCKDMEKEMQISLRPRFSPGYGDLSLEVQKCIFDTLGCAKRIGLTLNNSLLMSPSKSVTAFAGIVDKEKNEQNAENKCARCENIDCTFRGE